MTKCNYTQMINPESKCSTANSCRRIALRPEHRT